MANCKEDFFSDYLVLKPEEASLFDLVGLLCSSELKKSRFVDFLEGKQQRDLQLRWLIFISVLAQKVFFSLRKPMAYIDSMLELWLNLLSSNGGFIVLLLNILKGKVVRPNKSWATFTSVVGNTDKRVEFDRSIRHGDSRYSASLSMMAAKLSYEYEAFVRTVVRDHWKMEFLGFYNCWNDYEERYSTHAFMFRDTRSDPDLIVVAFRGTRPFDADAWRTDVDFSWYDIDGVGKIHVGFMKALGLQNGKGWPKEIQQGPDSGRPPFAYYTIRQALRDNLRKNERAKFIMTGHSLGGALAILFVAVLALHEEAWMMERLEGVYTFGQPRVGDKKFGEFMEEKLNVGHDVRYWRYVYCNDIVPRLPYSNKTLLYKHFGRCLYYNSCYKGKVVREEPNKNYFSMLWVIPMHLNAVWELIRGFIIPYMKGWDYTEGWLLRMLRILGLAFPGLSAHSPQDYVNTTRLGSLPSLDHLQDPIHQQDLDSSIFV